MVYQPVNMCFEVEVALLPSPQVAAHAAGPATDQQLIQGSSASLYVARRVQTRGFPNSL